MLFILPYWFFVGAALWWVTDVSASADRSIRVIGVGLVSIVVFAVVKEQAALPGWPYVIIAAFPSVALGWLAASLVDNPKATVAQALAIGAATLVLALAVIDSENHLFRNLTNLSAGGVSLAFSPKSSGGGQGAEPVVAAQSETANALPRTEAVGYVTGKIADLAAYIAQDHEMARMAAGMNETEGAKVYDKPAKDFEKFATDWLLPVGAVLRDEQSDHKSEFPSLADARKVSYLLRNAYDAYDPANAAPVDADSTDAAKSKQDREIDQQQTLVEQKLNGHVCGLALEVRPNSRKLAKVKGDYEKQKYGGDRAASFPSGKAPEFEYALRDVDAKKPCVEGEVAVDDQCSEQADPTKVKFCLKPNLQFPSIGAAKDLARSSYLGYLAALTAFSEDAEGNRESAIRILDDRIDKEEMLLAKPDEWANDSQFIGDKKVREYLISRKKLLLLRLLRWETTLMQFVSPSSPSKKLNKIAYSRYREFIEIDTSIMGRIDPERSIETYIKSPARAGSSCVAKTPWSDWKDDGLFYELLHSQLIFKNNAVFSAATNELINSRDGGVNGKVIEEVDKWASDVEGANLDCLKHGGASVDDTERSYFLESIGEWRAAQARNFSLPTDRGDPEHGCEALRVFSAALSSYPSYDGSKGRRFDMALDETQVELDKFSMTQEMHELKLWMRSAFSQSEIGCKLDP